jgi:hypothetical protein
MAHFDHIPGEDESVDDEYLLIGDDEKATNIAIQDASPYGGGYVVNEYDDGHATLSVRTIATATTLNHAKRIALEAYIAQGTHKYAHLIGKRVHFVDGLDNYPTVMVERGRVRHRHPLRRRLAVGEVGEPPPRTGRVGQRGTGVGLGGSGLPAAFANRSGGGRMYEKKPCTLWIVGEERYDLTDAAPGELLHRRSASDCASAYLRSKYNPVNL